ncbi:uncharacterized protein LOC132314519 [Cornus florida]|uniref:uncharacterized protein LOC132314519 n=1 Tax=Cornus florida TaxID=4283 RepID=UPI002896F4BF|nr:uncharacterized protein LOC132314519 [Cornus florida]
MTPEDEEKTAFITGKGTYCYKVMPFGLKNARATYQHLANKIFDEMLGKTVEPYIDDMVVKSVKKEEHPRHLQEVFDTLRKYGMKLNHSKCSFAVSSRQFLSHIVNKRGIEVTDQYQPKEDRMKAYREGVEIVSRGFNQIEFHQIPHEENSEADQLATAAFSSDEDLVRIVPIDILDEPSISPRQEIMVIRIVPRPYLKCLSPTEALTILQQIHDGDYGNHSGGRSMAHKVLTQDYFWPYLVQNAEEYARRCDKCQRHGPMKHQPAEDLHAMENPWPFTQ